MSSFPRNLSSARLQKIERAVLAFRDRKEFDQAWLAVEPLLKTQLQDSDVVECLLRLIEQGAFAKQHELSVVTQLFEAFQANPDVVGSLGQLLESLHDMRFLNAAPPGEPIFTRVAVRLEELLKAPANREEEISLLSGLSTAARILGRTWDGVAERCYLRLLELRPARWQDHYNLGLFYKTRGRFAEGLSANECAAELGGADREEVIWNLGICATGAGEVEKALGVWDSLGQQLELGRFNLPEGSYHSVKVRLAERPLAERMPPSDADDPGDEETIWVERLSPCHGIVRSALVYDLGVDYGDVVLFDGAPIAHHNYGQQSVPVFPHLTTLVHTKYQVFWFVGTQQHEKQIAELSNELPEDSVLYVHSEQLTHFCAACWENPDIDHERHPQSAQRSVRGKLCAPASIEEKRLRETLDSILDRTPDVRLFVPELSMAAGDPARAEVEARRIAMLQGA